MVLLHVKPSKQGGEEFLVETTTSSQVEPITLNVCGIHNQRVQIRAVLQVADAALAKKDGDLKERRDNGDDTKSADSNNIDTRLVAGAADSARRLLSKDEVQARKPSSLSELDACLDGLRRALSTSVALEEASPTNEGTFDPASCVLWFAQKPLQRTRALCEYIGANEKSKIIVKLSKSSSLPPVQESPIDEATHKTMLSYYYKKQEQQKELAKNRDDSYLNAAWADPNGPKTQITGLGDIHWRMR